MSDIERTPFTIFDLSTGDFRLTDVADGPPETDPAGSEWQDEDAVAPSAEAAGQRAASETEPEHRRELPLLADSVTTTPVAAASHQDAGANRHGESPSTADAGSDEGLHEDLESDHNANVEDAAALGDQNTGVRKSLGKRAVDGFKTALARGVEKTRQQADDALDAWEKAERRQAEIQSLLSAIALEGRQSSDEAGRFMRYVRLGYGVPTQPDHAPEAKPQTAFEKQVEQLQRRLIRNGHERFVKLVLREEVDE